ncbi:MAG: hypothetical protein IH987_11265, partial [Planctomycetes bacterium]|nr:hypothetical protein [Planctomycetota bacterium]
DDCILEGGIVAADPPKNAIDARQPHSINDAAAVMGWDSIELTMSETLVSVAPGDFSLSEVGDDGVAPSIIAAANLAGTDVLLTFDRPIDPGAWTQITHNASGTSTCIGYLPADANQDGLSSAGDINNLINSINLVPGLILPEYATDIDRSGQTLGTDILRLIDLLNGAGAFDSWITQSIGASPCS